MEPIDDSPASALEQDTGAAASSCGSQLVGIRTSGQQRQQAGPSGAGRVPLQGGEGSTPGAPGPPEEPAR
eukprot:10871732-Heterocapsa_arctica.AAC.1